MAQKEIKPKNLFSQTGLERNREAEEQRGGCPVHDLIEQKIEEGVVE